MECSCMVLSLIGESGVAGAVRIQQYAYLLARQEYDDWVQTRHYHYSPKLTLDLWVGLKDGLVSKTTEGELPVYSLTRKGKDVLKQTHPDKLDGLEDLRKMDLESLLAVT